MDCDWPWWIMFSAAMVSSYFKEMRLRKERKQPRQPFEASYRIRASAIPWPVLVASMAEAPGRVGIRVGISPGGPCHEVEVAVCQCLVEGEAAIEKPAQPLSKEVRKRTRMLLMSSQKDQAALSSIEYISESVYFICR